MDPGLFLADLERKPDVLGALADLIDRGDFRWPLRADPAPERVVLMGMGSSLYAAQAAALRLRANGVTAIAQSGSADATLPLAAHDVLVGISAGGGSVETNRLFAATTGGHRIALTNTPGSAITEHADAVMNLHAQAEVGGVACRSFTHTLVALLALEFQLASQPTQLAHTVRAAATATAHLLDHRADWLAITDELLSGPDGTWLLAPAERVSSALQGALMLREGPRRPAVGCETGDWSHVDVYLTKTLDYRALVFPGSRWDTQAADWLTQRERTVVAVGQPFPGARFVVEFPDADQPLVALITDTTVPELVAAHWWARNRAAG